MRLKEVLSFVNDKGGVGKTTTVQNLAAGILQMKKKSRVLIVDLDPQLAGISLLCGWRAEDGKRTMFDALSRQEAMPVYLVRDGLYLAPSSHQLTGIDAFLQAQMNPRKALCKMFGKPVQLDERDGGEQPITEAFDYVLIDCPPALSLLTYNAMSVASGIIVPMQLEALATVGVSSVLDAAKEVRDELNPSLTLRGILKVMVDNRTRATKTFKDNVQRMYGDYLFHTEVRRRTRIVEAQAAGQDIFAYDPTGVDSFDYLKFTKEILRA